MNGNILVPERVAVIDVDDVILPLNERVARRAGIDYERIITFSAMDNYALSEEERLRLYRAYQDPTLHDGLEPYPDAKEFLRLAGVPGLRPRIRSNSVSERSTAGKLKDLELLFGPDLDKFDVRIDLIDMSASHKKKMPRNAWALIDDSPHNAIASNAKHVLMRRKPWNLSDWGARMLAPIADRIFYYDESGQAVDEILRLLRLAQEEDRRRNCDAS